MTEADGRGQWYLHLFDTSQPDWDWRNPDVPALFEDVIRFWLDRGVAGLRVDVAHGIFKDPGTARPHRPAAPLNAPSAYRHRPELQPLYRSWRAILDSYPDDGFPGSRTAVGEVWYDVPETLKPYLEPGGLPQVFNFQLILAGWRAADFRAAIDSALAVTGGSRAPWVIGNHDVARPASRYRLDEGFTPQTISRLIALGDRNADAGARRAGRPRWCCSPCPVRPISTRARNWACPRSPIFRTARARIPDSSAPRASTPAATAAGYRSPGPVLVPDSVSAERARVPARPDRGCPSPRTGAGTAWSPSSPTSTPP